MKWLSETGKNLKKRFIQNPQCEIDDSFGTICSNLAFENAYRQFDGIIYGYENSTAHAYAQKYEYPFSAFIYGDANSDGKLTAGDAAFIAKNLAEQKGHTLPAYADFTGDGKVTAYDSSNDCKVSCRTKSEKLKKLIDKFVKCDKNTFNRMIVRF